MYKLSRRKSVEKMKDSWTGMSTKLNPAAANLADVRADRFGCRGNLFKPFAIFDGGAAVA
jgi:hypothetical protein